jgi:gluconokinase
MTKEFVIGLDIGTTSAKAVVFNKNGKVAAESEKLTKTYFPEPGWVEQDPEELLIASKLAVKEAIEKSSINPSELIGIGFSCAMHSLICVDQEGNPLSRAIIWSDGRSIEQAERLKNTSSGLEFYQKTGTPIHPMSPLVKMIWMKETNYDPFKQAAYFFSVKEYVIYKWFGTRVVDFAMASATGLFNGHTLQWDEDILNYLQISTDKLSMPVSPTKILSGMNPEAAREMGIAADLPFAVGAADGQLANLGVGAILPGEIVITAGTSGAVRQWATGFQTDERHETFSYRFTSDTSITGGPTNNGGIALEWLKGLLNYKGSYDEFTAEAVKAPVGANGLIFLPYVNGERAPLWNQQAKGTFFGMSIGHQKEHFVRAVLEGISFNLYQISLALKRLAGEPEKIYINGGLARSSFWLQMMADLFGKNIYMPESHHSAAWGAAWTTLVALSEAGSFEEIKENIPMSGIITPNEQNHKRYQEIFAKYARLAKDMSAYY